MLFPANGPLAMERVEAFRGTSPSLVTAPNPQDHCHCKMVFYSGKMILVIAQSKSTLRAAVLEQDLFEQEQFFKVKWRPDQPESLQEVMVAAFCLCSRRHVFVPTLMCRFCFCTAALLLVLFVLLPSSLHVSNQN